uniref:Rad21/Rec8-like protein N-terminal domain-containing protein n=1 Tax=Gouania willdenowi TaxID=441366 RepID=A0A8C5GEL1_GOUWI
LFFFPVFFRLVATKGIKVPRKDFLKVNVIRTCDDIMDYVLERVPPPQPGLPRPRFSLYLSSQLQYGVIVVFHRQCAILLDEIQYIVTKLLKKRSSQNIDIKDSRSHLVLPDVLSMMEEAEAALDPLFGVMQDVMPSPRTLVVIVFFSHQDLSPPVTPIRRRRRRRQLIFFDPETQLSEEVQQQQLNNPLIETRAPDYLPPSHLRMPSAAQLFNNPCFLPEEIQVLWRQAANITPILGLNLQVGERGIESTDSEREREQEMMEAAEREERRLSPEEILKLAAEAEMFEISGTVVVSAKTYTHTLKRRKV